MMMLAPNTNPGMDSTVSRSRLVFSASTLLYLVAHDSNPSIFS